MKRREYLKGEQIGKCIFINEEEPVIYKDISRSTIVRKALFECRCGKLFIAPIRDVKGERVKSCGCYKTEILKRTDNKHKNHGQWKHPLFSIWSSMKQRCYNSNEVAYKDYGGRGIKVCDEWHDINNFINDMYPSYQKGLYIDRIDNEKGYYKENCRWTDRKIQNNNKRNNIIIEYNGESDTASNWADRLNLHYKTFISRLKKWDDIDKVFNYIDNRIKTEQYQKYCENINK